MKIFASGFLLLAALSLTLSTAIASTQADNAEQLDQGSIEGSRMPQIRFEQSPVAGISVIAGGSAEFNALLRSVTDAESIRSLEPILPYSVILRNDTGESLIAITVRFYLIPESGPMIWHQMTLGTRSKKSWNLTAPGELMLITPETGLNTKILPEVPITIPEGPRLGVRLTKLANLYSRQKNVRIMIDSVVFQDGGVSGPDDRHILEELNAWADAEDEIMGQILNRRGPDLQLYLSTISNEKTQHQDTEEQFVMHRREFAQNLLSQLRASDSESRFLDSARERCANRIPHLRRRVK